MRTARRLLLVPAALVALAVAAPGQDKPDPFKKMFGEDRDAGAGDSLPEDPVDRGVALFRMGRHDEAQVLLEAARDKDPKDARALAALARLHLRCGRTAEAAAIATGLITLNATSVEARLLAGNAAIARGDLVGAEAEWRGAQALGRKAGGAAYLEALVRCGELLLDTNAHDDGGAMLEAVLAYYRGASELTTDEFVWVAKACRFADRVTAVKKGYQRGMVEYGRRMLDQALALDRRNVEAHIEAGELALSKFDIPMARTSFEKAVELDPNHPDARFGLASALVAQFYAGSGKYGDAQRNLNAALAVDGGHAGARALLASTAATDGELDQALDHVARGLEAHPGDPGLLAARAAVLLLRGDQAGFKAVEREVLSRRPRCARFFHDVAELVTNKFRYAEARDLCRRALEVDPDYHPVLALLGVSLTRTGDEVEGRRVLRRAFEEDKYNVFTFNALQLFDTLDAKYFTVEAPGFTIRLHKDETASADDVLGLAQEAREVLSKKYGAWPEHVLIEVFPEHADFSARSVGIPGIPALGVCFGNVVTVLSAGEKEAVGAHAWGRTMWHELTHVATLARTKNRIPRWLTEGLSVFEEPRGRPAWVRDFDRDVLTLMQRDLLLPIAGLDAGFTKPKYASQVMMSYYQGGILCEFIDGRWGFQAILRLLDAFAEGKATPEAVKLATGLECEQLDAEFLAFLNERYQPYAFLPPPGMEERAALLDALRVQPWDVGARGALARCYLLQGSGPDAETQAGLALRHASKALDVWGALTGVELALESTPGAASLASLRALSVRAGVADANLVLGVLAAQRGRPGLAMRRLGRALELRTRDPVLAHQTRANLFRAKRQPKAALAELEAIAREMPPSPDVERVLHGAYQAVNDVPRAMAHLRRVCALDSNDAKARLEYATWARDQNRWADVAEVLDDVNLIDPFIPDARALLGEALRRTATGDRKKLERGLREAERAIALKLTYQAGALYTQAACLEGLDRKPEALRQGKLALEADADHKEARELVARLEKAGVVPAPAPPATESPATEPAPPAPPPGDRR
jgi:tetratricopeptide (TPR) repeat protein